MSHPLLQTHGLPALSPIRQLAQQTTNDIINSTLELTFNTTAIHNVNDISDNELIDTESHTLTVPIQHIFTDIYNNQSMYSSYIQLCEQYSMDADIYHNNTLTQFLANIYDTCESNQYTIITILQQLKLYNNTSSNIDDIQQLSQSQGYERPTSRHGKRIDILGSDYQTSAQQQMYWNNDIHESNHSLHIDYQSPKLVHRRQLTPMPGTGDKLQSLQNVSIQPISYGIKFEPVPCIALCYDLYNDNTIIDRRVHSMELSWLTNEMSNEHAAARLIQSHQHHLPPTSTPQLCKLIQKLKNGRL